jgi:hypothetical protein
VPNHWGASCYAIWPKMLSCYRQSSNLLMEEQVKLPVSPSSIWFSISLGTIISDWILGSYILCLRLLDTPAPQQHDAYQIMIPALYRCCTAYSLPNLCEPFHLQWVIASTYELQHSTTHCPVIQCSILASPGISRWLAKI